MRRVLIYGAGDLGHRLLRMYRLVGVDVVGWIDDTREPGESIRGVPVVGGGDAAASACLEDVELGVILAIGYNRFEMRAERFESLRRAGVNFASCIHPSAVIDPSAELGPGAIVFSGVAVEHGARLGANVLLNTGAVVCHDVVIEDHAYVSPAAALAGFVTVERCAWVGLGASVLERVTIGRGAVVAAGAVVREDVGQFAMVAGVPAVIKKIREPFDCGD